MIKIMKYKIGQNVVCKPTHPVVGYLSGGEFLGTITDIIKNDYIIEDQDGDFYNLEEDEIELNTEI